MYVFQKYKVSFTRANFNAVIAHFTIGFCDRSQNGLRKPVLKMYLCNILTRTVPFLLKNGFFNILTNKELITSTISFIQCCFSGPILSLESLIYANA